MMLLTLDTTPPVLPGTNPAAGILSQPRTGAGARQRIVEQFDL